MSNILLYKDRYREEFADCIVEKYKLIQYGIQCAPTNVNSDLAYIRNEILGWAKNEDGGALTHVSVAYMSWLPVTFDGNPAAYIGGFNTTGQCSGGINPLCNLAMSYPTANGNVNIIDVNVGGCCTRINVNPNIIVNNGGGSYQYHITSASAIWTINHNLGFVPNVLTTNDVGNEIHGVVTLINAYTVVVEFSTAVTGFIYLS